MKVRVEVWENLSHFLAQSLSPQLLLPLPALETWKCFPGSKASLQRPPNVQADGGTEHNRQGEKAEVGFPLGLKGEAGLYSTLRLVTLHHHHCS